MLCLLGFAAAGCRDDHTARGRKLAAEHRWTEALAEYEKALERYPHDAAAAWGITEIYCFHTHHPDKCITWAERLLAVYPGRPEVRRAAAQGWRDRAAEERSRGDEAAARAAEAKAEELER